MSLGPGVALILLGALGAALSLIALWGRIDRRLAALLAGACGVAVGAGALLVQEGVSGLEWAATLVAIGVLAPVHATLVLGRPGRRA